MGWRQGVEIMWPFFLNDIPRISSGEFFRPIVSSSSIIVSSPSPCTAISTLVLVRSVLTIDEATEFPAIIKVFGWAFLIIDDKFLTIL